jgi:hypothetical protein
VVTLSLTSLFQYYYDNIVFAPFIFVEDPVDANSQRNLDSGPYRSLSRFPPQHSLSGNGSTVTLLVKSNKIDPYYLIVKASYLPYCQMKILIHPSIFRISSIPCV